MTVSQNQLETYGRFAAAKNASSNASSVWGGQEEREFDAPAGGTLPDALLEALREAILDAIEQAASWSTQSRFVTHQSELPGASPFEIIDERRSEKEKVNGQLSIMRRLTQVTSRHRMADRLDELALIAEEEGDSQDELSSASLRGFIRFLRSAPSLREPEIVLTPTGNVGAQWRAGPNRLCAVEFYPDADVHFVVFAPDLQDPSHTIRVSGTAPVESLITIMEPYGVMTWMGQ